MSVPTPKRSTFISIFSFLLCVVLLMYFTSSNEEYSLNDTPEYLTLALASPFPPKEMDPPSSAEQRFIDKAEAFKKNEMILKAEKEKVPVSSSEMSFSSDYESSEEEELREYVQNVQDILNIQRDLQWFNDSKGDEYSSSEEGKLKEQMQNMQDTSDTKNNLTGLNANDTYPTVVQQGCYLRGKIKGFLKLLPKDELEKLQCVQRIPDAIIFGIKKGGTTTLKEFLGFHPEISAAAKELKYLNTNYLVKKGASMYASMMPFSAEGQIAMEKTPGYLIRLQCADRLKAMIPYCKLIAILRDPVKRAISDYVHMKWVETHREGGASLLRKEVLKDLPHYEITDNFADSVLNQNGTVKDWNSLIDTGLYAKYIKYWFNLFPSSQFLFLDTESFTKNPTPSLQRIEKFLGLSPYFSEDNFHFDEEKGFYCVRKPLYSCMPEAKGRPHPAISESVITALQEFYEPHNQELSRLIGETFPWTTYPR